MLASGLVLTAVLVGCDGGTGQGSVPLFFGTNNYGSCSALTVDVDLQQAILAHQQDGTPDCVLDDALVNGGCSGTFSDDGATLAVAVSDCTIPPVSNLFRCNFRHADVLELDMQTAATCSCADEPICHLNDPCFHFPPVCISPTSDATCEECFNGLDDDGDQKIDCDDPICDADCGVGQSTVTCSSTSTSSVTISTL